MNTSRRRVGRRRWLAGNTLAASFTVGLALGCGGGEVAVGAAPTARPAGPTKLRALAPGAPRPVVVLGRQRALAPRAYEATIAPGVGAACVLERPGKTSLVFEACVADAADGAVVASRAGEAVLVGASRERVVPLGLAHPRLERVGSMLVAHAVGAAAVFDASTLEVRARGPLGAAGELVAVRGRGDDARLVVREPGGLAVLRASTLAPVGSSVAGELSAAPVEGRALVLSREPPELRVVSLDEAKVVATLPLPPRRARDAQPALALSSDGRKLAWHEDGALWLGDVGKKRWTQAVRGGPAHDALAFTADGAKLCGESARSWAPLYPASSTSPDTHTLAHEGVCLELRPHLPPGKSLAGNVSLFGARLETLVLSRDGRTLAHLAHAPSAPSTPNAPSAPGAVDVDLVLTDRASDAVRAVVSLGAIPTEAGLLEAARLELSADGERVAVWFDGEPHGLYDTKTGASLGAGDLAHVGGTARPAAAMLAPLGVLAPGSTPVAAAPTCTLGAATPRASDARAWLRFEGAEVTLEVAARDAKRCTPGLGERTWWVETSEGLVIAGRDGSSLATVLALGDDARGVFLRGGPFEVRGKGPFSIACVAGGELDEAARCADGLRIERAAERALSGTLDWLL